MARSYALFLWVASDITCAALNRSEPASQARAQIRVGEFLFFRYERLNREYFLEAQWNAEWQHHTDTQAESP